MLQFGVKIKLQTSQRGAGTPWDARGRPTTQNAPRRSQDAPKTRHVAPGRSQDALKTVLGSKSSISQNELENQGVRGPKVSSGAQIDPTRLREMKSIDFEEDRTRGGEKKDNKDDKKRQYELSKSSDTVWPKEDRRTTGKKVKQFGWPTPPESHPIRAVRKHK